MRSCFTKPGFFTKSGLYCLILIWFVVCTRNNWKRWITLLFVFLYLVNCCWVGLELGVYFLEANPDSHQLWRCSRRRSCCWHIWRYDNVSKEWVAGDYTKSFLLITIFKAFSYYQTSTFGKMSIATCQPSTYFTSFKDWWVFYLQKMSSRKPHGGPLTFFVIKWRH